METYQTEEQQVEAIKKFWQENGNSIIAGLLIGFAGFVGYGYYQDNKLQGELAVADAYLTMVEANENSAENFNQAGQAFIAEHGESSYAALTALTMAKNAAEQKDWPQAEDHLNTAIVKAPSEGIKALAMLRLARVQTQQENYTAALATLGQPMPASYLAAIEEAKGDIYVLQGDKAAARTAYQAAIDADGLAASPALQIKVDDLAVATK